MSEAKIPYCDTTWDLTIGCKKRSEGCADCWATRTVHGYCGDATRVYQTCEHGREWRETQRVNMLDWNLDKPLHWRKPRFVLVNSKSDLFDERVPFEYIVTIMGIIIATPWHRYMILTKEPGRAAEFMDWWMNEATRRRYLDLQVNMAMDALVDVPACQGQGFQRHIQRANRHYLDHCDQGDRGICDTPVPWPLPNVIWMVSVEGPEQMHRIETLRRIPAAMRGVSLEPLLSPLGGALTPFIEEGYNRCRSCGWYGMDDGDLSHGQAYPCPNCGEDTDAVPLDELLDWVVVGCEKRLGGAAGRWSGITPESWWIEADKIGQLCRNAGVAFWAKQGPRLTPLHASLKGPVRVTHRMAEFPAGCRVQEKPKGLIL